jgi:hypothetical protein
VEKVVVALWAPDPDDLEGFNARLRDTLVPSLISLGATGVRLNLQDARVAAGAALRQINSHPPIAAAVQFWLPTANARFRREIDGRLAACAHRFAAWLAVESTIIANSAHPPAPGRPTSGFAQLAWLGTPPRLTYPAWLEAWQGAHTPVAVETQANFEYVQNLFVHPLTADAPEIAAMVEECFPIAALTDPQVFFDASGDQAKYERNLAAMMASCQRFIDFDRIDVMVTSQYDRGPAQ